MTNTHDEVEVLLVEMRLAGAPPSVIRWYRHRFAMPFAVWPWTVDDIRQDIVQSPLKMAEVIAWGHRLPNWQPGEQE